MSKILIIEDYPNLLKLYKEEFESRDFDVALATNGTEGLELARAQDFDVILLDLMLPEMNGFDFLTAYSPARHPRVKIIILSNIYSHELVNTALQLGAHQYLLKANITPQRISKIVQQTLAEAKKLP